MPVVGADGNPLGEGDSFEVAVTIEDALGNKSDAVEAESVIDTEPPAAPEIDQINSSGEIKGTAEYVAHEGVSKSQVTLTFPDGSSVVVDVNENGTWSHTNPNLKDGDVVTATATDPAGNKSEEASSTVDATAETPSITDIVDAHGDYSDLTMHGKGEAGSTVSLYFADGTSVTHKGKPVTAVVDENGNWSIKVSDFDSVKADTNLYFKVDAVDAAGNQSEMSDTVHLYHGSFSDAHTEAADDYVFLGKGNDRVTINANDANDKLVVDGGTGTDTAVFKQSFDSYTVERSEDGKVVVFTDNSGTGDVIELRNFEKAEFTDGVYDVGTGDFLSNSVVLTLAPKYAEGENFFYEGKDITLEATLDRAALTDVVITLGNGKKITIEAGSTKGEVTFEIRLFAFEGVGKS